MYLEGRTQDEAMWALEGRFRVRREVARGDVAQVWADVDTLIAPDGACPIHDADLEVVPPFSQATSAPLRMDLALTYRCNDDCAHCYNARPRSFPEMPTQAWTQVLDRVHDIGVPHVCFTGGEATLRHDLPELTAHAASLGLVTGLLTKATSTGSGKRVWTTSRSRSNPTMRRPTIGWSAHPAPGARRCRGFAMRWRRRCTS
jgi:hypothetical protein